MISSNNWIKHVNKNNKKLAIQYYFLNFINLP